MKQSKHKQISPFRRSLRLTASNFIEHNVGRSAAALAYYLLFALFPLLIFVSNLLGFLDLNISSIAEALRTILPRDIVDLVEAYLNYVSTNSSQALLLFSLVFTIWFPMRAVKGLMDDVRRAYQLGKPKKPVGYAIRQVVFTLVFLLLIIVTLLLLTFGQRMLRWFLQWIPDSTISPALLTVWQYLRFILAAVMMFVALGMLYATAQDERQPIRAIMPGVFMAITAWLIISIGFSIYVENFGKFTIIYGTLGAVIVLLTWLYMTSTILILGAEWNAALRTVRSESAEPEAEEPALPV